MCSIKMSWAPVLPDAFDDTANFQIVNHFLYVSYTRKLAGHSVVWFPRTLSAQGLGVGGRRLVFLTPLQTQDATRKTEHAREVATMQLSCLQENLRRGLTTVGRAVAGKSTLPVLSNVLLETDASRLKLATTNLDIGVTTWIGAKIDSEGALTVPARLLTDVIGGLSNEIVQLNINHRAHTACTVRRHKCDTYRHFCRRIPRIATRIRANARRNLSSGSALRHYPASCVCHRNRRHAPDAHRCFAAHRRQNSDTHRCRRIPPCPADAYSGRGSTLATEHDHTGAH
jgi:hypothetical protein